MGYRLSDVQLSDQALGGNVAVRVLQDGGDFVPIHSAVSGQVEEYPQPA